MCTDSTDTSSSTLTQDLNLWLGSLIDLLNQFFCLCRPWFEITLEWQRFTVFTVETFNIQGALDQTDLMTPGLNSKGGIIGSPLLGSFTGVMLYTARILTMASHREASARCIPGHCLQRLKAQAKKCNEMKNLTSCQIQTLSCGDLGSQSSPSCLEHHSDQD